MEAADRGGLNPFFFRSTFLLYPHTMFPLSPGLNPFFFRSTFLPWIVGEYQGEGVLIPFSLGQHFFDKGLTIWREKWRS